MDILRIHLDAIAKRPKFSREEEHALALSAKAGDKSAREQLILAVLPWATKRAIATRKWIDPEDAAQVGALAAIRAVDKFDPNAGCRLTTYAAHWVRSMLERAWERRGLIGIPVKASSDDDDVVRARSLVRLDAPRALESGEPLDPQDYRDAGAEEVDFADEYRLAREIIGGLEPREQAILLGRCAGRTLKEIGSEFGITKERVRQIEQRALEQLGVAA